MHVRCRAASDPASRRRTHRQPPALCCTPRTRIRGFNGPLRYVRPLRFGPLHAVSLGTRRAGNGLLEPTVVRTDRQITSSFDASDPATAAATIAPTLTLRGTHAGDSSARDRTATISMASPMLHFHADNKRERELRAVPADGRAIAIKYHGVARTRVPPRLAADAQRTLCRERTLSRVRHR
jgi:hypothetical protein